MCAIFSLFIYKPIASTLADIHIPTSLFRLDGGTGEVKHREEKTDTYPYRTSS